jgi:hypothetical protein
MLVVSHPVIGETSITTPAPSASGPGSMRPADAVVSLNLARYGRISVVPH